MMMYNTARPFNRHSLQEEVIPPSALYINTGKIMQTCTKCKVEKSKDNFYKSNKYQCRQCQAENGRQRDRTRLGLIGSIYRTQIRSSKHRKHNPPAYSKDDLFAWFDKQESFSMLYTQWVKSDYEKMLRPSVDRIDDSIGYTLENIQLMSWDANAKKAHAGMLDGHLHCNHKQVAQYTKSGKFLKVFPSTASASREVGKVKQTIHAACRADGRTSAGFQWRYFEDTPLKAIEATYAYKNKGSLSGEHGITVAPNGKYQVAITLNKKVKYLGTFISIDDAILTRDNALRGVA